MERPTSTSGGSGNTGTSASTHSCCAGLAYYTLAMQQRGAKPVRAWPGLLGRECQHVVHAQPALCASSARLSGHVVPLGPTVLVKA